MIERGNGWIAKKDFTPDDYYFYLSFFSSTFFDKLLSIYSKQLSGSNNYYDLGNKFIKDIPIPNVMNQNIRESSAYILLKNIGEELSLNKPYSSSILDNTIETYFYNYD